MIASIPACPEYGTVEVVPMRCVGSGRASGASSYRRVADMAPRRWDLSWGSLTETQAREAVKRHFLDALGSVLPFTMDLPGPETVTVRYVAGTLAVSYTGSARSSISVTVEEALAV